MKNQQATDARASKNEFLDLLTTLTTGSDEKSKKKQRKHRREPRSISLQIQPLDLDFCPDGEAFWAVSRDVSNGGLGFINSEPISHEYVRIGLFEEKATMIARICHSTSIGVKYPLYLVGVQFLDEYYQ